MCGAVPRTKSNSIEAQQVHQGKRMEERREAAPYASCIIHLEILLISVLVAVLS